MPIYFFIPAIIVHLQLITFPAEYDRKSYLNIIEIDKNVLEKNKSSIIKKLEKKNLSQEEFEEKLEEELSKIDSAKTTVYKLSPDEEIALIQIDAMKEEIVNICRTKRDSGKDMFKLPPHKDADTGASEATMHDDRAYVLAMLGWYLSEKRLSNIRNKKRQVDNSNIIDNFMIRTPQRHESIFS